MTSKRIEYMCPSVTVMLIKLTHPLLQTSTEESLSSSESFDSGFDDIGW